MKPTDDPLGDLWEGEEVLPLPSAATLARQSHPPASIERLIRGDHVEVGERLREALETNGVISFAAESLWQCNGKKFFEKLDDSEVARTVHAYAGSAVALKKNQPLTLKQSDVRGAIAVLKDLVADPDFFHDAPRGISFRDCFVALQGNTLAKRPNGPDNRARHQLPFDYVPNAVPHRQILDFLGDCFAGCPDAAERVECIRQTVGLCLLGLGPHFHRALIFHGGGANGKSVLLSLIRAAFPDTAVCAVAAQRWGHEYHRAALAGRRINLVSELPEGDIIDSSSFKAIISGDVTQGRHPYGRPFDFHPEAGHIFATNTLPGTNDQTEGFWRRFVVIGFPNAVLPQKQDPNLAQKLQAHLPGFVGWCLAGALEAFTANALTIPASSGPALEAWRLESDQVAGFLQDNTESADAPTTAASELYRQYRSWCALNGHKQLSSTSFGRRMKLAGHEPTRNKHGLFYSLRLRYVSE